MVWIEANYLVWIEANYLVWIEANYLVWIWLEVVVLCLKDQLFDLGSKRMARRVRTGSSMKLVGFTKQVESGLRTPFGPVVAQLARCFRMLSPWQKKTVLRSVVPLAMDSAWRNMTSSK